MTTEAEALGSPEFVGPVLQAGALANEIVAAIQATNFDVVVVNRGGYIRVHARGRCQLSRASMERITSRPFQMPGDLETVMSSFKGKFRVSSEAAIWEAR